MWVSIELGFGFLCVALCIGLISRNALTTPPVRDGIGGQDTNNLAMGCFGPFVALGFAAAGVICLIVGGIIGLTQS